MSAMCPERSEDVRGASCESRCLWNDYLRNAAPPSVFIALNWSIGRELGPPLLHR